MENNFNTNMNLGNVINNNTNDAVAPVFTTATMGNSSGLGISMDNTPLTNVQNMHVQVDAVAPVVETEPVAQTTEQEPLKGINQVVVDNFVIPTAILKNLVSRARKVGNDNPIQIQSQVISLELGSFGIKVNTSNGKVDFECVDASYGFTKTLKACISIKPLGELLNNIDDSVVELAYDDASNILTLKTADGSEYKYAQRIDNSTQQPIDLSLTFPISFNDMTEIDFASIVTAINISKPIRSMPKVNEAFDGLYFGERITSSEGTVILLQDNQPILKTQRMFIDSDFAELLATLPFNVGKTKIGFTTDGSNDIRAITVSDGNLTLCGGVQTEYPIDANVLESYWRANYTAKVAIDTKKFSNALKRISIFANQNENDFAEFQVTGNIMRIVPNTAGAIDFVDIVNESGYTGKFEVSLTKMVSLFNSIKSQNFVLSVDTENEVCICLELDGVKWIVARVED